MISRGPVDFLIYFLSFFFPPSPPSPTSLLPLSLHTHTHTLRQEFLQGIYYALLMGLTTYSEEAMLFAAEPNFSRWHRERQPWVPGTDLELAGWLGQFCCSISDAFTTAYCMISVLFPSCFSCAFKYLYEIGCGIPTLPCCNALVRCWFSALTSIEQRGRN